MEISHLKEFVTLAQIGLYQEAAEVLYVSQSTLSKHIRRLEEELGAELFTPEGNRRQLTAIGKIFLPYAVNILELESEYTSAISLAKFKESECTIGVSTDALFYQKHLAQFLTKLRPRNAKHLENDSIALRKMLSVHKCDFIVVCTLNPAGADFSSFERAALFRDPIVAVVSPGSEFAGRERVSVRELAHCHFVNMGFPSTFGYFERQILDAEETHPHFSHLSTSKLFLVFSDIKANGSVALLPESLVDPNSISRSELIAVKLQEQYCVTLDVLYRKRSLKKVDGSL